MTSCNSKSTEIRNAFRKAVESTSKAFMLDADEASNARLYRVRPRVEYIRDYSEDNEVKSVSTEIYLNVTDDRDDFTLSLDGALELVRHLTEIIEKLDKMEDKYLAALEKVSKDKVEASKEVKETFEF